MKFRNRNIRFPKDAAWLLPGLQIKRWFLMIIAGTVVSLIGICILFEQRPIYFMISLVKEVAHTVPSNVIAFTFIFLGALIFFKGWQKSNYSILDLHGDRDKRAVFEVLYRRRMLNRGPKIVAIGGGTGLSTLLKGIKKLTNNITAVVTVGDDGGSSGRLREEMGVLPPGDIRNCIAALADDEDLVTKLFQYRFNTGEGLGGHSFGNLFLTALCAITGDMVRAVKESSKVLSIRGRVLPSTLDDMRLVAQMEDGSTVKGESNIPEAGKKIQKLYTEPANCKPLDDVIMAIRGADLIILGPGSLYTSVIPNLLIKEIVREISDSDAKKIYICNIMTQPGETDNFSVSDHLKTIFDHAQTSAVVDAVLVNDSLPIEPVDDYKAAKSHPVVLDVENVQKLGVKIVMKKLIDSDSKLIRHNSKRLASAIASWYKKGNNVKVKKKLSDDDKKCNCADVCKK